MSVPYQSTDQQLPTYDGTVYKNEDRDGDSNDDDAEGSRSDKKPRHRRNYQACEPCRERKVKCDLGDVDNPSKGPCAKCARESKTCWFRETRKKDAGKNANVERASKRQRTDSMHSERTVPTIATYGNHSPVAPNGFPYAANPLSPSRAYPPPTSSPGALNHMSSTPTISGFTSPPRSTPQMSRSNNLYTAQQNGMSQQAAYSNGASNNLRGTNGDDHVVMPQAKSLSQAFTNTTDNMSVLVRAATTTEANGDPYAHQQRQRALTGSAGDIDLRSLPPQAARVRQQARQVWSQMRFVRAGWFTADEALQYIDYFYKFLAPMTPVVTQDFSDPLTHRQLLSEEPVLALAILAISSRYYELKSASKISRAYYIHEKLWDALRKIVQRLLWGQEQFGGGFTGAGMVPMQETVTGQITWKGSLRTLGTIEALLLLTDWQPRALHFPPGDDENKLVGAGFALLEDEKPRPAESVNVPYATWLEPAWRSDRMSWMLLGLAQSLSFELGVFDTRHEHCAGVHGPSSDCMRRRRIRRLVITYVSQISGRIGIQSSVSPQQDVDPRGPEAHTSVDYMQKLWFDIANIMFDANRDIFPSRETTSALVENGQYKMAIAKLKPRLDEWLKTYTNHQDKLKDEMKYVLRMEYEYARLYINSLGLQKVVIGMAVQDRNTTSRGLSTQMAPLYEENRDHIEQVRDAAHQILMASCHGLGGMGALGYSPVRTFLRTLSAMMFSLKLLILGNEERKVRSTFKLLREMTKRITEQVVDDVHLSPHSAILVRQIMEDMHKTMVRIPKPGSRGQSRNLSPQPQQTAGISMPQSGTPDKESPDSFGQIPFADYTSQTLMMPSTFDINSNFDASMAFDSMDPTLLSSGEDWISMPLDNLMNFDAGTVNQGYGGIGPTFGERDLLSVVTGSHLDQNMPDGVTNNFQNFPSTF